MLWRPKITAASSTVMLVARTEDNLEKVTSEIRV